MLIICCGWMMTMRNKADFDEVLIDEVEDGDRRSETKT